MIGRNVKLGFSKLLAALTASALLLSPPGWAQGAPDPKVAVPIILKVLTYDKQFDSRGKGDFVVLVVSESGQSASRAQVLEVLKSLPVTSIRNRPLKFIAAEFADQGGLAADAAQLGAHALLAVPGLSPGGVGAIAAVAKSRQLYSLALDVAMVEKALALGVGSASGRPQIVINESAARAVGAQFETSVLKLARVVQ